MRRADAMDQLNGLYARYHDVRYLASDPLVIVRRYRDVADREIVALLGAGLAYGRVASILNSLEALLERMGGSPSAFVHGESAGTIHRALDGFQHRWSTGREVEEVVAGLRAFGPGGMQSTFVEGLRRDEDTVLPALSRWVGRFERKGRNSLLVDPAAGSACKRMCLFLRWMVREDEIDPGGWPRISRSKLVVPVDVHMHRMAKRLGFTRRKSATLRTVEEITRAFRRIEPTDPTRYDFALTRPGILGELRPPGRIRSRTPAAAAP